MKRLHISGSSAPIRVYFDFSRLTVACDFFDYAVEGDCFKFKALIKSGRGQQLQVGVDCYVLKGGNGCGTETFVACKQRSVYPGHLFLYDKFGKSLPYPEQLGSVRGVNRVVSVNQLGVLSKLYINKFGTAVKTHRSDFLQTCRQLHEGQLGAVFERVFGQTFYALLHVEVFELLRESRVYSFFVAVRHIQFVQNEIIKEHSCIHFGYGFSVECRRKGNLRGQRLLYVFLQSIAFPVLIESKIKIAYVGRHVIVHCGVRHVGA